MEESCLEQFPASGKRLVFADSVKDDLRIDGVKLQLCQFHQIGARNAKITNSSLTQCMFVDTYLRDASFSNVQLTGSTFRNCNLTRTRFQGCDLSYCVFQNTSFDKNEIAANLPCQPNLKRALARNLRKNCEDLGDKKSADFFMDIEIAAEEQEYCNRFFRRTAYYRDKYTSVDQVKAGAQFLKSRFSGLVWGYGHRIWRLIVSYALLILVFSFVTSYCRLLFIVDNMPSARAMSLWESFYYVLSDTLGFGAGPVIPATVSAQILHLSQSFLGTIFLAMLVAALYRKIAR